MVAQAWLSEIGPAPHLHFASYEKLACWVSLCPGNNISAASASTAAPGMPGPTSSRCWSRPHGRQSGSGASCRARYNRLVRRFGGDKSSGAKKKAITAIAHTLVKIAYQVLNSGVPYQDLGADFYTRRESPEQK